MRNIEAKIDHDTAVETEGSGEQIPVDLIEELINDQFQAIKDETREMYTLGEIHSASQALKFITYYN